MIATCGSSEQWQVQLHFMNDSGCDVRQKATEVSSRWFIVFVVYEAMIGRNMFWNAMNALSKTITLKAHTIAKLLCKHLLLKSIISRCINQKYIRKYVCFKLTTQLPGNYPILCIFGMQAFCSATIALSAGPAQTIPAP